MLVMHELCHLEIEAISLIFKGKRGWANQLTHHYGAIRFFDAPL
jgi:hypothetical protein